MRESVPPPLPLQSLSHLSRVVRDVERSIEFYTNVLGFREIKRPSSFEFEGSWLIGYGTSIHLIQGSPVRKARPINPSDDHTSFQAASLEEVEQRLQAFDIPFERTTVEENGILVSQVFFHDPDYNMIEICNCDCLPVVPLTDMPSLPKTCCNQHHQQSPHASRPSMELSAMHFDPASIRHLRSETA